MLQGANETLRFSQFVLSENFSNKVNLHNAGFPFGGGMFELKIYNTCINEEKLVAPQKS